MQVVSASMEREILAGPLREEAALVATGCTTAGRGEARGLAATRRELLAGPAIDRV